MKMFANVWLTIKPTVRRFPAFFTLSALVALFTSVWWVLEVGSPNSHDSLLAIIKACVWAGVLSLVLQLATECCFLATTKTGQALHKKAAFLRLLSQLGCLLLPLALGILICKSNSSRFYLVYFGTLFALLMTAGTLLHRYQRQSLVIPNIIIAGMIAGIICGCISAGGCIIALAVEKLIYDFSAHAEYVYPLICIVAGSFFLPCVFISYATKEDADIVIPKAFTLIFQFVLFPLYVLLLLVLYVYLIKSLCLRAMPSGFINPFVSFATVCYLLFYLTLQDSRNRVTDFFYRFGAFFIFPLIAVQCLAFAIRVSAYGMTGARQASLFYIIFSIVVCLLSILYRGKKISCIYPIFALLCLFASISPFNLIDGPARNQAGRMKALLVKNAMLDAAGLHPATDGGALLSVEDKQGLVSAYDALYNSEAKKPAWYQAAVAAQGEKSGDSLFPLLFGFPHKDYSQQGAVTLYYGYTLQVPKEFTMDVSSWKQMTSFAHEKSQNDDEELSVAFDLAEEQVDLTQLLQPRLHETDASSFWLLSERESRDSTEPLLLHQTGYDLLLTEAILFVEQGDDSGWRWSVKGYLCR